MFSRVQFRRTFKKHEDQDTDPFLLTKNVTLQRDTDIRTYYSIGVYLGSGKFGEVKRCQEKKTGREFAAKFVSITSEEDMNSILNEIAIMNTLRHPRLIQLYDAYHFDEEVTLVLELITGGELFERIIDESFNLNESRCIKFMHEILQGVEYMHSQNVIHLDLKPENILCLSATSFKTKIIDFGLARFYQNQNLCVLFGTPEFVSPEVISYEPISPAADMWSLGVICYVMLSGLSPFMGESQGETLANIIRVKYNFDYAEFAEISNDAMDFIRKLLVKDPRKRMTATECLQHQWLKQKKTLKRSGTVSKKRLKHFVYRRKWQKAVNAIIALQRMGVVLQHSPVIPPRHRSQSLRRSFIESETIRRSKLQQVTEHKLLPNSPTMTTPTPVGKESVPNELTVKKHSGLFRKTSLFGKTRKDADATPPTNDTTTTNSNNISNVTKVKNKMNENPTDQCSPRKSKLDLSFKLKHKESGRGFMTFQRHKNSQQSTSSSDSPSVIPKISIVSNERNSVSSDKSETVVTTSKAQQKDVLPSSSTFGKKGQNKDSTPKITQLSQKQSTPPIIKDKKSSTSSTKNTLKIPEISVSNSINDNNQSLTKEPSVNKINEKEKSTTGNVGTSTMNTLANTTTKVSDISSTGVKPITSTSSTQQNFNHKIASKTKTPSSISNSDIALKINFFSNLSKEGKVK
ncbi:Myosin light chain kinase, smooth muscle isoform 1 [Schistosoma japonicum]|uniref:Myosin light chain kinase, smooth muscle isoform 1 n=2 Tax=Schistosoma japonicum TaxID=6182 RepID=A0A4Z2D736_SCHJA|nr:Myosin light chain kinase, smooth muscle isoform 1 [Schistosoma japonicum]